MRKQFDIPQYYRSTFVTALKAKQRQGYRRGMPLPPIEINLGPVNFKMAFHFGLCFGVENAIDIAYKAIEENPGKKIYLLSQMIHNPHVNADLQARGVAFLMTPEGEELVPFSALTQDDVVIVPAFGASVEIFKRLNEFGASLKTYNTTCPFVEKVWRRAELLGDQGYSVVIHGKHTHEETRATFSHAVQNAKSVVVRDLAEATQLCKYIRGEKDVSEFFREFEGKYSDAFDPSCDLIRLGVVNQTTMLATETQEISNLIRSALVDRFGEAELAKHFADTRDTLCYATNENQSAIHALLDTQGDIAIIVGGFNSSNTSHLVEIAEQKLPTYYIEGPSQIISLQSVQHYNMHNKSIVTSDDWYDGRNPLTILLSAGASSPDAQVERVIERIAELLNAKEALETFKRSFVSADPERSGLTIST